METALEMVEESGETSVNALTRRLIDELSVEDVNEFLEKILSDEPYSDHALKFMDKVTNDEEE